jgi:hypothetical protein
VGKFFSSLGVALNIACAIAFFANIGLLLYANLNDLYDLQMLSIFNMMMLSFVLLRDGNK